MSREEARARIAEGYDVIQHYDLQRWSDEFMAAIQNTTENA
jgi:trehalose-6-phosphate synthase